MMSTVAYSCIAAFQLYVMHRASESGTLQTQKLIRLSETSAQAATDSAAAANEFAQSASAIDEGVQTAVSKLETQAVETRALARNALQQAVATRELTVQTSNNTRKTLESDRAWLAVSEVNVLPFKIEKQIFITLVMRNSGKTPAVAVRSGIIGSNEMNYTAESPAFDRMVKAARKVVVQNDAVIPPNGTMPVHIESPFALTPQQLAEITAGTFIPTYVGRVEYKDVSNRDQWLEYCIRLTPRGDWRFCQVGNNMSY